MANNFTRSFFVKPTKTCIFNIKNYSQEVVSATQCQNVKPFQDIPGPSGKGLPIFGHMNDLIKKPHGPFKTWENLKEMRKKFMIENEMAGKIMKLYLPMLNPPSKASDDTFSNGWCIALFDPNDIPLVYQNEGKYPFRYISTNYSLIQIICFLNPYYLSLSTLLAYENHNSISEVRCLNILK